MSASFSLVSTRPNGICVTVRKLKFTSAVFLRCPSFVLLPHSTASRNESLSAVPISGLWMPFPAEFERFSTSYSSFHGRRALDCFCVNTRCRSRGLSLSIPLHWERAPVLPSQHDQSRTTARRSKARVAASEVFYIFPHIVATSDECQVARDCVCVTKNVMCWTLSQPNRSTCPKSNRVVTGAVANLFSCILPLE